MPSSFKGELQQGVITVTQTGLGRTCGPAQSLDPGAVVSIVICTRSHPRFLEMPGSLLFRPQEINWASGESNFINVSPFLIFPAVMIFNYTLDPVIHDGRTNPTALGPLAELCLCHNVRRSKETQLKCLLYKQKQKEATIRD